MAIGRNDSLLSLLRIGVVIAACLASLPAGVVSARFFPLMRRAIQIGSLPQYPAATLMHDSCATLRINRMPEFCERVYKLRTPDPALATTYTEQLTQAGWQIVEHRTAQAYDWYARRIVGLECYALRTWVWGLNESLIVAVFDQRAIFIAGSDDINYCARYIRM